MHIPDEEYRLKEDQLQVGEPIPWDLCNRQGRVVFRKGFVINTQASLERVLCMKLYIAAETAGTGEASTKPVSDAALLQSHTVVGPLRIIDFLADQLSELFSGICHGPRPELAELDRFIEAMMKHCSAHSDTCLAAVHFNHGRSYQSLHALYSQFLARQLSGLLGYDEAQSASLAGAALTANLGMFEYHDEWASQSGGLSEEQNRVRLEHPARSADRLLELGVTDTLWLQIVRQHHELLDGSGYPEGISGDQVLEGALIVGLVDRYLAWILPRAGRKATQPSKILQGIFKDAGLYGERLVRLLIKVVGVYPPGTPVELASGEIAVVVKRNMEDSAHPMAAVVKQQDDRYSAEQPVRDTREERYRVVDVYFPAKGEPNPALMIKTWQ